MKLLIVAGGGGHFAPALSVIEKLPKDWEVLVVGRKSPFEGDKSFSFEYLSAKKLNIPFSPITTGRFQRKLTWHSLNFFAKTPVGLVQSFAILRKFKPDVVLIFGGYVAFPVTIAAAFFKIPIVVHEQTLEAGESNKFAAKFAKNVCISWDESKKFFPREKVVLTGNPLRNSKFKIQNSKLQKKDLPIIYITGGSGGAHAINSLIEGCVEKLLQKYIVIHQTGDSSEFNDYKRLNQLKESLAEDLKKRYEIEKFIDSNKVFEIMQMSSLIISRSGINTVTELLYFGKPALLIPLPYGQKNEQLKNALFLKKVGLAEVAEQRSLTPEDLSLKISQMFANIDMYRKKGKDARKLINTDAADKIIEVVKNARDKKKAQKKY